MSTLPKRITELAPEQLGLVALRAAVKKAIAQHAKEGVPITVRRNGKMVHIPASRLSKSTKRRAVKRK